MVRFNVDSLDFEDDEETRFGSDTDYATRFDSANSRLELADLTNGTTGYVPQDVGTDLVGGKYAQTVAEGKALADDGNVYDSIQTAVNNASSYVKIGPGEFREYITIDTTGLTLEGSGERTEIIGVEVTGGVSNIRITAIHTSNITVDANDTFIHNNTVIPENENTDGISVFSNSTNVSIFNNHIQDLNFQGIGYIKGSNHSIISNTIINIGQRGIIFQSDNSLICKNYIKGTEYSGIVVDANDNIVLANRIDSVDRNGIKVTGIENIIAKNIVSNASNTEINDRGTNNKLDANITT